MYPQITVCENILWPPNSLDDSDHGDHLPLSTVLKDLTQGLAFQKVHQNAVDIPSLQVTVLPEEDTDDTEVKS